MTSKPEKSTLFLYSLLNHATRIGGYAFIILGSAVLLLTLLIVLAPLFTNRPNSGNAAGPLIVGMLLASGFIWLGFWLRSGSKYYRARYEYAADENAVAVAPASHAATADDHDIHFSRKWTPQQDDLKRPGRLDRAIPIYITILCVTAAGFGFQRNLHLPREEFFFVLFCSCAPASFWVFMPAWIQWRRFRAARNDLASRPDENFRLRCVGLPEDFEQRGGLIDVPFEPMIFNVSWSSIAYLNPVAKSTSIGVGVLAVATCFFVMDAFDSVYAMTGLAASAFAILAAYSVTFLLWQTYIEVSPGRLDFSWVLMFGRGRSRGFTVDLRTARVLVDTRNWRVFIEQPESERPRLAFSIVLVPHRMELAYRILLAAISSHDSPRAPAGAENALD